VRAAGDVLPAIARDLGVRGLDDRPLPEQLARARARRRDLIVLDNFEQVLDAAPDIVSLFDHLPDATFLVTSRARLRVRGEHVFEVEPLALPPDPAVATVEAALASPAVRLFRDRSRAADPRFDVTPDNASDVARLCCALEGVPLSIELAAARIRALPPAAMLARLDTVLPLLVTSARDLPERQRTIRATVQWSIDLLGDDARTLFTRLGVFAGDFSLEAVEAVTAGEPWSDDLLELILELVDCSLLRQHGDDEVPLFSMLTPVLELATARFASDAGADAARRAHADFYVRLAGEAESRLRGRTQLATLDRLESERDNIRAAYRWLLEIGEVDAVADALWNLFLYWWICNLMLEAKTWAQELTAGSAGPLSARTRAIALVFPMWVSLWQADTQIDARPFEEAVEIFRSEGDELDLGLALTVLALGYMSTSTPDLGRAEATQRAALDLTAIQRDPPLRALLRGALGRILFLRGDVEGSIRLFEESQVEAASAADPFIESVALTQLGWARLAAGDPTPEAFVRNLELALDLRNDNGVAFALEGLAATALVGGDIEGAGELFGAAEAFRARSGLADQRAYVTYQPYLEAVRASDQGPMFEAARARGGRLSRAAVIEKARARSARP
jgi:predicted ATPase